MRFELAIVALGFAGCGFHPALTGDALDMPGGDADAPQGPPDAYVAIVPVQTATSTAGGSHMSDSATLAVPQKAGDLIVVVASWAGGVTPVTCADSAGNGFKPLFAPMSIGGVTQASCYAENIRDSTADTVTITAGSNESNIALRIVEYSGIAADALDQKAVATGTGTTASSGQVQTTHHHELLYGASTNTNIASGAGPGYAQRLLYAGDVVEDAEALTIGPYTATVDEGGVESWIMMLATFRAAS